MENPKPVNLCAHAEQDIDSAARYYDQEGSLALGLRFYDSVEGGLLQISRNPEIGSLRHSNNATLAGVRYWPVPSFENHLIFYRVTPEAVDVLRVLHGARDLFALLTEEDLS